MRHTYFLTKGQQSDDSLSETKKIYKKIIFIILQCDCKDQIYADLFASLLMYL